MNQPLIEQIEQTDHQMDTCHHLITDLESHYAGSVRRVDTYTPYEECDVSCTFKPYKVVGDDNITVSLTKENVRDLLKEQQKENQQRMEALRQEVMKTYDI